MEKQDYHLKLQSKFGSDLSKLIKYYAIDYDKGYANEFSNKNIQDSVDDLFRILFNLNQENALSNSNINNHVIEKTLGILSNYYVLDEQLSKLN